MRGHELDELCAAHASEQQKNRYMKIFQLAQAINDKQSGTKIDYGYYCTDQELSVIIYPPNYLDHPETIKNLSVSEIKGNMIMWNQIRFIEGYLEGVLKSETERG